VLYLVLMYAVAEETRTMSASLREAVARKHEAFRLELTTSGELLNGAGLQLPDETTASRFGSSGQTHITGPLIAAHEHVTAYYVLDCATRERAIALAERVLDEHVIAVEVRGIHDWFGMVKYGGEPLAGPSDTGTDRS